MHKFIFLLISLITCSSFSCTKEADINRLTSEATIGWYGNYASDGCGFLIEIENMYYKPIDEEKIDASFKQKPTRVIIEYQLLDEKDPRQCGLNPEAIFDQIQLLSIQKK